MTLLTKNSYPFHICWKHADHGSDELGCSFKTVAAAEAEIERIQSDPVASGHVEWLKDATLWVVDEFGNIR